MNFHVIFSDQIPLFAIEQQFIARLEATYRLNADSPAVSWSAAPTIEALEDLGRKIIDSVDQQRRAQYNSPLVEGFNNFNVSLESIHKALKSHYFEGKFLTAVGKTEWSAVKWLDGSIAEKKTIINGVDFVFISAATADLAVRARDDLAAAGVNARLLDCSDAHHFGDSPEKDRLGKCFTWIRADPTFDGLRHALHEFADRTYLGDEPLLLRRVRTAPMRTIVGLALRRRFGSSLAEPWFDGVDVPINPGMVAIVGNKGSGKSAFLDILGLLGDSQRQDSASFLSQKRFRRPTENKASHFEGRITWASGDGEWLSLASDVPPSAVERVAYLPQSLFETICNELATIDGGKFDQELKRVIYSHVREQDRLGHEALDEWLEHRTSEIQATADERRLRLTETNRRIVALESRLRPEHKAELQARLEQRERELKDHELRRPAVVPAPATEAEPQMREALARLSKLTKERNALAAELDREREAEASANASLVELDLLQARLVRLAREVNAALSDTNAAMSSLGLTFESVVTFSLALEPLEELRTAKSETRDAAKRRTDQLDQSALPAQLAKLDEAIASVQVQLDEPNRLYQEFRQALSTWEAEERQIKGDGELVGSQEYLKEQIALLSELPSELEDLLEERREIAAAILRGHAEAKGYLRELYAPVQEFIDGSDIAKRTMKLSFFAAVQDAGFTQQFLDWIHQGRIGSFAGREEGERRIRELLQSYDLDAVEGALHFAEAVLEQMTRDVRPGARPQPMLVADQLRATRSVEGFYDFLFGFQYLTPRYGLLFGGRELAELSPGEKGSLLLVFYLLVDRSDVPLLIDQPEENLDNETIYELLVPSIRLAKQRRQVIIVTHNPNLAVVCDADQVIAATRASSGEPEIRYATGAIECPSINRRLVDVLEGTRPAFDNRNTKYL